MNGFQRSLFLINVQVKLDNHLERKQQDHWATSVFDREVIMVAPVAQI
jgi:hypothetical protein